MKKSHLTPIQQTIARGGWICRDCAIANSGTWPDGHIATQGYFNCIVCEEIKCCADRSDWNFIFLKLRPAEREF